MKTLGIVVPTYNEAENIKDLVIKIKDSLKETDIKTRVLVVDDNSPDGTGKICLLYTSDAADERSSVDLGGRRIIKKKKK